MIAEANFFDRNPQPLVLYVNIVSKNNELIGDCENCGEKGVQIFEHDCLYPDVNVVAHRIIAKAEEAQLEQQQKTSSAYWLLNLVILALVITLMFLIGIF